MIQENEVIMLLIGIGIMIFILENKKRFNKITRWPILLTAYSLMLLAWIFTVFEGFFMPEVLNFLEHLSYTLSTLAAAFWCWHVFTNKGAVP